MARLQPIEKPRGLFLRLAFWACRVYFGKVMTAMKILYARLPGFLSLQLHAQWFRARGLRLQPELKLLVEIAVSRINGCAFCTDLHIAQALLEHMPQAKLDALTDPERSPALSEPERAALAFSAEVVARKVSGETFTRLRRSFDERAVVELVWLVGYITSLNLAASALDISSDGFCTWVREKQHAA